jgi:hypothetical protein
MQVTFNLLIEIKNARLLNPSLSGAHLRFASGVPLRFRVGVGQRKTKNKKRY